MEPRTSVDIADRVSRKRAVVVAVAALAFVAIHIGLRPFFYVGGGGSIDWWAVNAILLLAGLATGGGLLNARSIRALVNDDVSRDHYKTAVIIGYWLAMVVAMGLYLWPGLRGATAREAVFIIVTPSVALALLAFSFLELRAHRDA